MKDKLTFNSLLLLALFSALAPAAFASATWYVNGVSGNNSNNCLSPSTACKTIGHAISLASSGDTIMVAAATYKENLSISKSLNIIGFGASTTIIDGGGMKTVVTVSNANAHVGLSNLTIRNGSAKSGGGIYNIGTLAISNSTITANRAGALGGGGGIYNVGGLTIYNSTISGNQGIGTIEGFSQGGGIYNGGTMTVSRSTVRGNNLRDGEGGGIANAGNETIINSTIVGNNGFLRGGGIVSAVTT